MRKINQRRGLVRVGEDAVLDRVDRVGLSGKVTCKKRHEKARELSAGRASKAERMIRR